MDKDVFLGWLSGILELVKAEKLSQEDAQAIISSIQDHLKLVVKKVTPDRVPQVAPIIKPAPDNKITPMSPWPFPRVKDGYPTPREQDYWLDKYVPGSIGYEIKDHRFPPGTVIC